MSNLLKKVKKKLQKNQIAIIYALIINNLSNFNIFLLIFIIIIYFNLA